MERSLVSIRLPSLDGWRAVSITIVLAAHSRYVEGYPSSLYQPVGVLTDTGNLGVRFFFVISGFLITWLLLCENDSNSCRGINLKNFYIRRVLRIFPVYFFFLAAVALLQMETPFRQGTREWLGNLTFTTNFFGDGRLTGHLWSLAIEEQFYLIWPGIFLLFGIASNLRKALWILSIPILIGPISRIIVRKHYYPDNLKWFFDYFPTTSFIDSIAIGCGCAILFFKKREMIADFFQKNSSKLPFVSFFLLGVPILMNQFQLPGRLQALLCHTMQAVGFSILLLDSIASPEKFFYRLLNLRFVKLIGVLSYSIYIWQQIFCNPKLLGIDPELWWVSFPGWIVPTCVVAFLSYYILELPFFRLRKRYGSIHKETLKSNI